MPRMPAAEAERGGEKGRVVGFEDRQQRECGSSLSARLVDRTEAGSLAIEAKEELGIGGGLPLEPAVLG